MAHMVDIGSCSINADHIVSVSRPEEGGGRIRIELDSGRTVEAGAEYYEAVMGRRSIRQIVPVAGCYARTEDYDGSLNYEQVHCLALTGDGEVRPLDVAEDLTEFFDDYCNYKGICWNPEIGGGGIPT